jgi:hypothetical protein
MSSAAAIPLPVPRALAVDLAPADVAGVWRATRLATLLAPTPALRLYRVLARLYADARPALVAAVTSRVARLRASVAAATAAAVAVAAASSQQAVAHRQPSDQRRRTFAAVFDDEIDLDVGDSNGDEPVVASSTGFIVPAVCLRVYREVLRDPRMRAQKIRDSRLVLAGPVSIPDVLNFRRLYADYTASLDLTLAVTNEYTARAGLSRADSRTVQALVIAGIDKASARRR